jgi:cytochrome c oxidase subunit 2
VKERTVFFSAILGIAMVAVGILVATQVNLMPEAASTRAAPVDQLFRVLLGVSTVIFLLVEGALVYAVIRFRRRPGDDSDAAPVHGNTSLEILWSLIPAAIVVVIGVYSFQVLTAIETPGRQPLVVEVIGRQFSWQFRYPDQNLETSELHLPVGQPVVFRITSEDMIHSFWVPDFRAKKDATPGQVSELAMTPSQVGRFPIRCAELCGAGHAIMVSDVVVEQPDEFEAWLEQQKAMAGDPGQIFLTMGCGACHTLAAAGTNAAIGPSLDGLAARAGEQVAGEAAEAYVQRSILEPDAFIVPTFQPGIMPKNFGDWLTPEQIQALVAFLLAQP